MSGVLYLVPSPIGNIDDVSKRVINTLLNVDFIACEDTRNTYKLLNILDIKNKKCVSCHEHNETTASQGIIKEILDGKDVAYLSDAGYPCISDPGYLLAVECIKNNIKIVPISGASAFLNGLVGSGLDTSHFLFYGFLESKSGERKKELNILKKLPYTLIFYEAPHRINDTLKDIYEVFGERNIVICRELTKIHEDFLRTTLSEIVKNPQQFKGEIVLVVDKCVVANNTPAFDEKEITAKADELMKNGLTKKDAISSISILLNIPKNVVKKILL